MKILVFKSLCCESCKLRYGWISIFLYSNIYNFESKDTILLRNEQILSSKYKSIVKDDDDNVYNFENFFYFIEEKILKGNDVSIITNFNNIKSDNFEQLPENSSFESSNIIIKPYIEYELYNNINYEKQ